MTKAEERRIRALEQAFNLEPRIIDCSSSKEELLKKMAVTDEVLQRASSVKLDPDFVAGMRRAIQEMVKTTEKRFNVRLVSRK